MSYNPFDNENEEENYEEDDGLNPFDEPEDGNNPFDLDDNNDKPIKKSIF